MDSLGQSKVNVGTCAGLHWKDWMGEISFLYKILRFVFSVPIVPCPLSLDVLAPTAFKHGLAG